MGLSTDSMISQLEANGVIHMSVAQLGDLLDLDRRIKDGDESGWRGDPSMGVFVNTITGHFEVWGIDRGGNGYLAASHDKLDHTLLIKLREGDPTRHDTFQRVLDHNAKVVADQKAAAHDKLTEAGDKLQWAIRKDFGQHMGGTRRQWHIDKGISSPIKPKE
jgi:hypothetical protein